MNLAQAYLEVAQRSLDAADAALGADIQEATSFYSYHAFESVGGAFCAAQGVSYPKGHNRKINEFVSITSRPKFKSKLGFPVSTVAIQIASIRNKSLYPEEMAGGKVETPNQYISPKDAERVLRRVKGVLKKVKTFI